MKQYPLPVSFPAAFPILFCHHTSMLWFYSNKKGADISPRLFALFCLLLRCAPRTAPKNDINERKGGRCSSNGKNRRPMPLCWGNGFQTSCSIGMRHEFLCSSLRIEYLCGAVCQKNRILHTILTGRRNQQHRGRHTGEQAKSNNAIPPARPTGANRALNQNRKHTEQNELHHFTANPKS